MQTKRQVKCKYSIVTDEPGIELNNLEGKLWFFFVFKPLALLHFHFLKAASTKQEKISPSCCSERHHTHTHTSKEFPSLRSAWGKSPFF